MKTKKVTRPRRFTLNLLRLIMEPWRLTLELWRFILEPFSVMILIIMNARIRIHLTVKVSFGSALTKTEDPDPHLSENLNTDSRQSDAFINTG